MIKIQIKGSLLKQALENGVQAWPKMDGRWPITSGLKFTFDPARPKGDKILQETMITDDGFGNTAPYDMDKVYSLAVTSYMAQGKDGFEAFLDDSIVRFYSDLDEELDIRDLVNDFLRYWQKSEEEFL